MVIRRIVRMSFHPENSDAFEEIFWLSRSKILARDGCLEVLLLQDVKEKNVYFTHSVWKDEESLNSYRKSELFGSVWPATKKLFNEKAQAWSLESKELRSV